MARRLVATSHQLVSRVAPATARWIKTAEFIVEKQELTEALFRMGMQVASRSHKAVMDEVNPQPYDS
jgi:hypothetical protein